MRLFEGTQFDIPPRCERCGALESDCGCPEPEPVRTAPDKQTARVSEEKRKNGKRVTVIRGLLDEGESLVELCTKLKNACGAGGTVRDGAIEIQGRLSDRVRKLLGQMGYRVK